MKQDQQALKLPGFFRVFGETIWAGFKALLIIALIHSVGLANLLNKSRSAETMQEAFGASLLMSMIGVIMMIPAIIILACINTPAIRYCLKKNWNNLYLFIIVTIIVAVTFNKSIIIFNDGLTSKNLLLFNPYYFLGGGLTGFFLYRQIQKLPRADKKMSTDD